MVLLLPAQEAVECSSLDLLDSYFCYMSALVCRFDKTLQQVEAEPSEGELDRLRKLQLDIAVTYRKLEEIMSEINRLKIRLPEKLEFRKTFLKALISFCFRYSAQEGRACRRHMEMDCEFCLKFCSNLIETEDALVQISKGGLVDASKWFTRVVRLTADALKERDEPCNLIGGGMFDVLFLLKLQAFKELVACDGVDVKEAAELALSDDAEMALLSSCSEQEDFEDFLNKIRHLRKSDENISFDAATLDELNQKFPPLARVILKEIGPIDVAPEVDIHSPTALKDLIRMAKAPVIGKLETTRGLDKADARVSYTALGKEFETYDNAFQSLFHVEDETVQLSEAEFFTQAQPGFTATRASSPPLIVINTPPERAREQVVEFDTPPDHAEAPQSPVPPRQQPSPPPLPPPPPVRRNSEYPTRQHHQEEEVRRVSEPSIAAPSTSNLADNSIPSRKRTKARKAWTPEELAALEEGIRCFGPQWVRIKRKYDQVLINRSNVDLKDKARNEIQARRKAGKDLGGFARLG